MGLATHLIKKNTFNLTAYYNDNNITSRHGTDSSIYHTITCPGWNL